MRALGGTILLALALAGLFGSSASAATSGTVENEHAVVTATCSSLTITYRNFPNATSNKVSQTITIHGAHVSKAVLVFNGPSLTYTTTIAVPPGSGVVDDAASWNTNGVKGHFDLGVPLECPAAPAFTITKLQRIAGSAAGFTQEPVTGRLGQSVEYEIVVKNTGNEPLTLSNFTDEHCTGLSGGPGGEKLYLRASTTYLCSHVLSQVGPYENSATVTAQPPARGAPITETSNTVFVTVPAEPSFTITKQQEIEGSNAGYTVAPLTFTVGQTVDYEIVVKNTGNVPLTLSELEDVKCESITGGPGAGPLAPGSSTSYFCHHLLSEPKSYSNTASITGTPPPGDGGPITEVSNPVVVVSNPKEMGKTENKNGEVTATCSYVSITYRNFPNLPNNKVTETIKVNGTTVIKKVFTFNGPTGTELIPLVVHAGSSVVDDFARWNTNGYKGHFDLGVPLECPPEPAFTITKLQEIEGSNAGFTTSPLSGKVGQTVRYEVVVQNTGNVALSFRNFTDEQCQEVTGGPGTQRVPLRASTTYFCRHTLSEVGPYSNTATITGNGPIGDGPRITHSSNTVVTTAE